MSTMSDDEMKSMLRSWRPPIVTQPTKTEPSREETLRSSDWVEALAKRWERKIYLESDPYTDDDDKMGATSHLINCVKELRADMARASTDPSSATRGGDR